ncbi:glycerol-3-phosphate-acyltransferase [Toxoplasma gondii VAND]|uniref:Glycerol-3-phosphate-acyltransferase n=1 Tax=Toxoplasma gondii VAND TaxID=933077 RepID=A0A086PK90_TOXGO|nr:glycerol-3-phosphate-acyltransferase [Toxoplasma gondii VAND]
MYFLVRWLCIGIVRSFFKEVAVLHPERIPLYGPAIFVGNHNNQFMDASMLVANIPRQVHFLVALKSMKRRVIGFLSRLAGCIPVDRQDDRAFKGPGLVRISHHFTEDGHVCPRPPHHHHHARPHAADPGHSNGSESREKRDGGGGRPPETATEERQTPHADTGALHTPSGAVQAGSILLSGEAEAARRSAFEGTAGGTSEARMETKNEDDPREPQTREDGPSAESAAIPEAQTPELRAHTRGESPAKLLAGEMLQAFSRVPSHPSLRTEMPLFSKSASAPLGMQNPPVLSILGNSTRFLSDVRPGYKLRLDGKDFLVLRVLSDTHVVVRQPPEAPRRLDSSPLPTAAAPGGRTPETAGAVCELDRKTAERRGDAIARQANAQLAKEKESEREAKMGRRRGSFSSESSSSSTGSRSQRGSSRRTNVGETAANAAAAAEAFATREDVPGLSQNGSSTALDANGRERETALLKAVPGTRGVDEGRLREQAFAEMRRPVSPDPSAFGASRDEGLRRRRARRREEDREEKWRETHDGPGPGDSRGENDAGGLPGKMCDGREEGEDRLHQALSAKHEKEKRLAAAAYKEYKILPKIEQREVYEAVTHSLVDGDCIGIFPEGGSHDRTTLLPLKPGVAIMAIGGAAAGADVMIVPVGLVYHNPHKTQSRATIHIGEPIPISREAVVEYQQDRRAATARILTDVEHGMRSCIITAQDHETMTLIHLCCSLYPPERLRLSPEKLFNLNQLLSKLFWRCADSPELSNLRQDLAQYQGALQRAGIPDHDVWMLKQSTAGASLCFAEKLIALLFAIGLGVPLLPLWGPLRVIAYFLAERHRAQALAASSVKVKGMDVVASYKVIVLLVCVPLFNLVYGAIFGLVFRRTLAETLATMLLCICLLPVAYYFSMRQAEKILPLIRQMRTLIIVVVGKVNIWRENERELITQRMNLQFSVRETLLKLGPQTSPAFMEELYSILPKAVLVADIKRLIRKKEDFAPLQMKSLMNNAEEIL